MPHGRIETVKIPGVNEAPGTSAGAQGNVGHSSSQEEGKWGNEATVAGAARPLSRPGRRLVHLERGGRERSRSAESDRGHRGSGGAAHRGLDGNLAGPARATRS